jgi:predicted O-linked N-acetylglucosamine transferase (SPINDLY family)
MDYRLTDPFLDPPGAGDGDYTERSIRLPHCFWCYAPPSDSPPVGELPAQRGGVVTFGCLNQFAKVSLATLRLWVKVLQAIPSSRLVIQAQPSAHIEQVRALFRAGGVTDERVAFAPRLDRMAYFLRYHSLDLGLDPFPYNGHTSTLDALWMGVPVITLAGRTAVGRGGVSILSNVGLDELIAATPQLYVDLAVSWASDLPRLARLRAGLRERVRTSAPMDGPGYAAAVEEAFRRMWVASFAGER